MTFLELKVRLHALGVHDSDTVFFSDILDGDDEPEDLTVRRHDWGVEVFR